MSGWRSIFACLKAVKIEQHRRSIELKTGKENKDDENEQAGVELYRVNAILEVLEAFFSCENLNVLSQASVDCLQCLFCYLREPGIDVRVPTQFRSSLFCSRSIHTDGQQSIRRQFR